MQARLFNDDVRKLQPIAEAWLQEAKVNDFGVLADDMNKYLAELHAMALGPDSNLIVLYNEEEPVGYVGLRYFQSPMGNQVVANEHYFYVLPQHRGLSSIRLLQTAKLLAQLRGCTHIIFNASRMASDLHDKVCRLYEKLGMKHFETTYISEIE